jgi:U3 small nucleolar RNA-associated protein 20
VGRLLTSAQSDIAQQVTRYSRPRTRYDLQDSCHLGLALLPVLLRELLAALLRGPQLHVLAFVFHAVPTQVTAAQGSNELAIDDLDDSAAHVSAEVTLGESGKDVQHEDFRTKMREVRSSSSKGLDCFGLTARYVSPKRISALLPLRSIIAETSSFKMLQQVDEVLRRIASGLNANTRLTPPELLILSHLDQSEYQVSCRKYRSSKETSLARKTILSYNCNAKLSRTDHYTNNYFR